MRRIVVTAFSVALLAALAAADDTLWTRIFYDGQNTVPARVRCGGSNAYVVAGISDALTIYTMVLAYGDNGDLLWQKFINWHFADNPTALAVGADGNPVVGITAGSAWFTFLVKFTAGGDTVWTRRISNSTPRALATDASNNIVVLGLRGPSSQDSLWLAKFDTYGNEVWSRSYKLGDNHTVGGVGLDAADNIYAAITVTAGGEVAMVVKFDNQGNIATTWTPAIGAACTGISVLADGSCYIVGQTKLGKLRSNGETEWITGAIVQSGLARDVAHVADGVYVTYASQGDCWIRKFNPEGRSVRSVRVSRPASGDAPVSIAVDADGKPVITGTATETYYKGLTIKFAAIPGIGDAGRLPVRAGDQVPARLVTGNSLPWQVERPGEYRFTVRDGLGRRVAEELRLELAAGSVQIPLPPLAPGLYFVTAASQGSRVCQKVLLPGR